ncbi:MAG: hypothetical protein ACREO1_06040 [Arenimonas sp.]
MKHLVGFAFLSRIIAIVSLSVSMTAHAGKITTESTVDGKQSVEIIEFNELGHARITSKGLDTIGVILRDQNVYFYGKLDGKPVVVDILAAVKKLAADGKSRPESKPGVEEIEDIKPTGRKQNVAGLVGEVHNVTWTLDGKKRNEEVVLSRDPRLGNLIKSLRIDPGMLSETPKKSDLREEAIARNYFLLKSELSSVTSVDFSPVADERFALKAPPVADVEVLLAVVLITAFEAIGDAVNSEMKTDSGTANEVAEPATESESDSEESRAPLPSSKVMLDGLMAISPGGGLQLPAASNSDSANWPSFNVGLASVRIPPNLSVYSDDGKGSQDHTIGFTSMSGDFYVELRQRQDSDSSYMQTAVDHANSDYGRSPDRFKEGVILGFQPMLIDGAVGSVEIMNLYGRVKDEDGSLTPRMITWRGRWEKNDQIQSIELTARFDQDKQDKFAPIVSNILATIKASNTPEPVK